MELQLRPTYSTCQRHDKSKLCAVIMMLFRIGSRERRRTTNKVAGMEHARLGTFRASMMQAWYKPALVATEQNNHVGGIHIHTIYFR